jgi:hypothetical protein
MTVIRIALTHIVPTGSMKRTPAIAAVDSDRSTRMPMARPAARAARA